MYKINWLLKVKYISLGIIIGFFFISSGIYAYNTQAGTIGILFKKITHDYLDDITGEYRLMGDKIENNTIDTTEIEDESIISEDIKNGEIKEDDIADNSISRGKIKDGSISSNVSEWTVTGSICDGRACIGYCLNSINDVVGMKWMNDTENYDECFNVESGSLIKIITYYK